MSFTVLGKKSVCIIEMFRKYLTYCNTSNTLRAGILDALVIFNKQQVF